MLQGKVDFTPWKPNHAALDNYEENYNGDRIKCYELADEGSPAPFVLTNMAKLSCARANKAIKKAMRDK